MWLLVAYAVAVTVALVVQHVWLRRRLAEDRVRRVLLGYALGRSARR